MFQGKKVFWALMILTITGLLLRIMLVFNLGDFIFDETVSVMIAQRSWQEIWHYLKIEIHPAVHFYYLYFWIKIFGGAEEIVRFSSVVISAFCFPVLYLLGKEIFNSKKAGLAAVALFSFSSFLIFYSVVARMYILVFLLTSFSFYLFLKIYKKERPGLFWHSAYIFITLSAYYTHLTCGVIILVQLAFLFLYNPLKIKKFLVDWLVVVMLYLPWFLFFLSHKFASLDSHAWFFGSPNYKNVLLYPFKFIVIGEGDLPGAVFGVLIATMFLFLVFNLFQERKHIEWKKTTLPLLILAVPFVLLVAGRLTVMRYFVIPCLGLILIAGYFLSKVNYRRISGVFFIAFFSVLLFFSIKAVVVDFSISWQKGFGFIEEREQEGDKVVLAHDNLLTLAEMYYHGQAPLLSFDSDKKEDELRQVLEKCNYASEINSDTRDLIKELESSPRIFLVINKNMFSFSQQKIKEYMIEEGWKIEARNNQGNLEVFLLTFS